MALGSHYEGLTPGQVVMADGTTSLGFSNPNQVTIDQSAYSTVRATIDLLTTAAPTAITAAALTVADGAGTNDGTIGAITGDASVIAAVQELAAQIGKLVTDLTSVRTQLVAAQADILSMKKNDNQIIDILQAAKLAG